ncbi:MAG: sigma factor-like helix-turn-helix DNA-binding protein, partial [Bacteroidota bacterium]
LPPKRLEVFKLRYYEGLDNSGIAQQLGISINTVKVHLAKARLYLKQQIHSEQGLYWGLLFLFLFS